MGIMKTLTINGMTYNVVPTVPSSHVTLLASAWEGSGDRYSQVVQIPGVTPRTKVDLQLSSTQAVYFHSKVQGFVAENNGGVVTVFAIGDKPHDDHTFQVTMTEVEATGTIRGNVVSTTMPRSDWAQTDPTKADYIPNKHTTLGGGLALAVSAVGGFGRRTVRAMVSFMDDDCRAAVYRRKTETPNEPSLWELIMELGIPYTLACPPGSIYDPDNPVAGNEEYLAVGELQTMYNGGITISCHHWRQYNMDEFESAEAYGADLDRCLEKFAAWGIRDVISVSYPQGVIHDDHFQEARNRFLMGYAVTKGINQRPYASYRMDRCEVFPRGDAYREDPTLALTEAKARVDALVESGGWLIFMTHAWYDTFSPADLRSLVEYIRGKGIDIVDTNEAIRTSGNVIEIGDFAKPMDSQTNAFFVVDADGNVHTNALHSHTRRTDSLIPVSVGYNLGYIGGENGTRMSSTDTDRWISDDIAVQAGEVYRLTCSAVWSGAAYAVLTASTGGTVVDKVAGDVNTPSTVLTDHDITIPNGGAILRVSSNLTVQPEGFKIYRVTKT